MTETLRALAVSGLALLLAAAAPTPPDPPAEIEAGRAPVPREKPLHVVPLPAERPPEATADEEAPEEAPETAPEEAPQEAPQEGPLPPSGEAGEDAGEDDVAPAGAAPLDGSDTPGLRPDETQGDTEPAEESDTSGQPGAQESGRDSDEESGQGSEEESEQESGDRGDVDPASGDAASGDAAGDEVPMPPETPVEVEKAREDAKANAAPPIVDTTEFADEAACRLRLERLPAEWELTGPIGENRCGIGEAVRLETAAGLELRPAANVNCRTAEALTLWLRDEVIPAAEEDLKAKPKAVLIASSYVCRNRYGRADGKISEHAFGNAVDIGGFILDKETFGVRLQDPKDAPERASFQTEIRKAACERFTTVLGPGSNEAHATHFHFDLRRRSRGYRLCE